MRVKDKRVLALVKAFLKAGILTEFGETQDTHTGTPQGGILSPLLANIALAVLDEHLMGPWKPGGTMSTESRRAGRRAKGLPTWRLVRYCDDFVVLVNGTQDDTEALREDVAQVLEPMGLRLSPAKTRVASLGDGFDFLGVSHPVAPQARHEQVVRLHLHRRSADPVGEGEDPCPDEQDVATGSRIRADRTQPGHARLGQLLQTCRGQTNVRCSRPLRVVANDPDAHGPAPLELEGRPTPFHHP